MEPKITLLIMLQDQLKCWMDNVCNIFESDILIHTQQPSFDKDFQFVLELLEDFKEKEGT